MVWPILSKILCFSEFFEPITTQSQPNHAPIFVHPTFAGLLNSLFFATFGINTLSLKSRDACKLLEPILVSLQKIASFIPLGHPNGGLAKQFVLYIVPGREIVHTCSKNSTACNFSQTDKPIGASPLTKCHFSHYLFWLHRILWEMGGGGLKKGGNATRATESQRCKSSAS